MTLADAGHSALMDRVYRNQRHIYDLTRAYYLLGRDRLIAGLRLGARDRVLEVGCGTGRNLVATAHAYPLSQIFGMDISSEMLASARSAAHRARLEQRLSLAQGDATDFDPARAFGVTSFDRIFMSYTLSMIPDWRAAVEQAMRNLAPGGSLHIVDFGQQERLPGWFRTLLFKWLGMFHVSPRADLRETLAKIAQVHGADLDIRALYRGYAWIAVLRRR
ncbi:MAG: class I SAM-dependent methyltransferase [Parvibaculum sp.]|uniref:class I SAM-dependent methyltransferase n=1 Tax=Parvibaculum sp. TaxID=2024848 RepID=UPI00283C3907|nr:class I SAM-dependent methyltransferase [Parvibaculum sp.]MDR3497826.1 class I SAM-dependent methyltransferase [Parvibaculum sp.]